MKLFSIICALSLISLAPVALGQGEEEGVVQRQHMPPESQLTFLDTLYEYKSLAEKTARNSATSRKNGGATKDSQVRLHFERDNQLTSGLDQGFREVPNLESMREEDLYELVLKDLQRIYPGSLILQILSKEQEENRRLMLLKRFSQSSRARYPEHIEGEIEYVKKLLEIPNHFNEWTAMVTRSSGGEIGLSFSLSDKGGFERGFALEFGDTLEGYQASFSKYAVGDQVVVSGRFLRSPSGLLGSPEDLSWSKIRHYSIQSDNTALISPYLMLLGSSRKIDISEEIIQSHEGSDASLIHPSFFVEILSVAKNPRENSAGTHKLQGAPAETKYAISLRNTITLLDDVTKDIKSLLSKLNEVERDIEKYPDSFYAARRVLNSKIEIFLTRCRERRVKSWELPEAKFKKFSGGVLTIQTKPGTYYKKPYSILKDARADLDKLEKRPAFGSIVIQKSILLSRARILDYEYQLYSVLLDWKETEIRDRFGPGQSFGSEKLCDRVRGKLHDLKNARQDVWDRLHEREKPSLLELVESMGPTLGKN